MSAVDVAYALGGRKSGSAWVARCPAHTDRTPSLSISRGDNGKLLFHCFAGCDQQPVIAALRCRGLWQGQLGWRQLPNIPSPVCDRPKHRSDAHRSKLAQEIWDSGKPAKGTIVETYLLSRGRASRTEDGAQ
jgi:putative DNA primase/helicase